MSDVNDFLLASGVPSAKFPAIGAVVKGTVLSSEMMQQTKLGTNEPLTWDDGRPRMQAVITLQTAERDPAVEDDDGKRRLFVKGEMQKAVAAALKVAGAKLDLGGTLAVKYTGDGPKGTNGFNAPKLYAAEYRPPVAQPGGASLLGDTEPVTSGVPASELV